MPKGFKRRKQNDTQKKRRGGHSTPPTTTHRRGPEGSRYHFSLANTRAHGGMQPAVSWSDLTEEAREALDTHDFGIGVPFNSYNFADNLNRACSRYR
ncbi:NPP1 family protein [Sinorhizobium medicae]